MNIFTGKENLFNRLILLGVLISGNVPAAPVTVVTTAGAAQAAAEVEKTYLGRVEAIRSTPIVARVQGFIAQRHFHDGDWVNAGQALFEIDPAEQEAAATRARAAVTSAQANVNNARLHFNRLNRLTAAQAVSQADKDRAKANLEVALAALSKANADLATQRITLGYTRITAPFSGRISHSAYYPGTLVGPATGSLATLTQLDPLRVVVSINEPDYLREVAQGTSPQSRTLEDISPQLRLSDGSRYTHTGRFDAWDNAIDPLTGTVALRLQFPNPDEKLLPGGVVRVVMHSSSPAPLMIPAAALQQDKNGHFVMIVNARSLVEKRRVTVGAPTQGMYPVISGLSDEQRVIVSGIQHLQAGDAVTPSTQS
ncbi:efflux RND transporter periplasmic adaptor subunit [Brenneria corticis]|uniref:Efflux transporter periplasmic adaptor subunit n=1 Tax=Brenneria corticis TaxID=2173106 RepID=A0A2U1TR60_9GAMM|nr:efflux RND transporter periplasmic adaptor subunit [Brenneria sp. CFCC 11842]PWC11886.1 efflux transporter periplasmic adaptor subunit [Brenneria sp. CFCC 11842]